MAAHSRGLSVSVDDDELNDIREAWRAAGRDPHDVEFLELPEDPSARALDTCRIAVRDRRTGRSKIYEYVTARSDWPRTVADDLAVGVFG
jgi:hypothetical protein